MKQIKKSSNYTALPCFPIQKIMIVFLLFSYSAFSQEKTVYDVQTLKLDENSADDIISFREVQPYLSGIADLRQHVLENQEDYPMEQKAIETSRDKKHEAHKRWERYMRKLPVYVRLIDDMNNFIIVETQISNTIEVCSKFNDVLIVKIKNKNNYLINAEIELQPNKLINYPKEKDEIEILSKKDIETKFEYINNGKATFTLPANSEISVKIPVVYNCDGKKGSTYNISEDQIDISHKINLVGYLYNKYKKELYRITSKNIITSKVKLTYL